MSFPESKDPEDMTVAELLAIARIDCQRRARMSASRKGVPKSPEHKKAISEGHQRRQRERKQRAADQSPRAS